MGSKYARGKYAVGMCGRCGMKVPYREMVSDGQFPGLRVHRSCRDKKHPVEKPFVAAEGIALHHPAPDIDDDSGTLNDANEVLVDGLDGESFGGGT
jgi:hypothetical protein